MKTTTSRASLAVAALLAVAWLASPVSAQAQSAPAPAQAVQPAPAGPAPSATVPSAPAPSASTPAAPTALPAATVSTTAKSEAAAVAPAMKELSPWMMFMSADIIVQAVMIGLAFASLMTWTVFIAKSIELSVASGKLRSALKRIAEAHSLAEAQMALGTKQGILPSFLAAALHEARMSAGLSSDAGIKERAASSFQEIVRAEQRRIRIGMGVLATIGSTSPFVGLFGTVWGIMNSFIGISKSQTTNLAVVAPGIAEALLATAIGLVAAIPAVIIYNHFSRVTKGYLELVSRASGAAGRLLSRDLDRSHGGLHSRAAE
ncbi:MAG: tonB-system energizer ExbB [Bradyrhizobium sp.]|uniref:tonB-system energizer ExbB n=1 Tax=Bradyrhizobium sp. TaxID=376 RepID=UPI001A18D21B|nr:tonB-system energizer ExbB [Bradyrhizobium sp.]MBJ7405484.1 tonB-system energizer ExbB [Bradyrhizobium sp.]